MGGLGCGLSLVAVLFAVIGTVPFLGWLNWFTTLPAALLAIIFSVIALATNRQTPLAALGLVAAIFALFWVVFRLAVGGGII